MSNFIKLGAINEFDEYTKTFYYINIELIECIVLYEKEYHLVDSDEHCEHVCCLIGSGIKYRCSFEEVKAKIPALV